MKFRFTVLLLLPLIFSNYTPHTTATGWNFFFKGCFSGSITAECRRRVTQNQRDREQQNENAEHNRTGVNPDPRNHWQTNLDGAFAGIPEPGGWSHAFLRNHPHFNHHVPHPVHAGFHPPPTMPQPAPAGFHTNPMMHNFHHSRSNSEYSTADSESTNSESDSVHANQHFPHATPHGNPTGQPPMPPGAEQTPNTFSAQFDHHFRMP